MLSPQDDLPLHQVPETMATVGTTDRHFYDRYYFNLHAASDELFVVVGSGQYPNLGVTDAFVAASVGDTQHVVRASRELGLDRLDTTVGPIGVEVLEGLRRLRVTCRGDDLPIDLDATFDAAMPALQEPRQTAVAPHGRRYMNTMRFVQTGDWEGHLEVAGERFDVTPDAFHGNRDRSWGVRPVGDPEPEGISGPVTGFFWIYAIAQFDDHTVVAMIQEDPDGTRAMEEAVRVPGDPDADGQERPLGSPEHRLEFVSGTRDVRRATLSFAHGGQLTAEPLRPVRLARGTGYGFDEDWRHGRYQGPDLVVQQRGYDLSADDVQPIPGAITDHVARFETADGQVGHGLFEVMTLGPDATYFGGWDDVAD